MSDWIRSFWDQLPSIERPKLSRDVEIAVYLIHNSAEAEDYFFLFDFEEFADRSKSGLFVRPVIRVFAGRDDFSRVVFARNFREVFAAEFDRMRSDLADKQSRRGWLSWGVNTVVGGAVGLLVLAAAFATDGWFFTSVERGEKPARSKLRRRANWFGKSVEAKLADDIEETKGRVETALQRIEVTLHPELAEHARGLGGGRASGLDRDAWPLPSYVRAHLDDRRSGSWW